MKQAMQLAALCGSMLASLPHLAAGVLSTGYLVVSSPAEKTLFAARLLSAAEQSRNIVMELNPLTPDPGYQQVFGTPKGVAVDSTNGLIYIADPGKSRILAMDIFEKKDLADTIPGMPYHGTVHVENPRAIIEDCNAAWVSVDAVGTLFYSDGTANEIQSLTLEGVKDRIDAATVLLGAPTPEETAEDAAAAEASTDDAAEASDAVTTVQVRDLYSLRSTPAHVVAPEGIAVNGFNVFWANGQDGQNSGTVNRAPEIPPDEYRDLSVTRMATNNNAATGVCLSSTRVFWTVDGEGMGYVYSVRNQGGTVKMVTDRLTRPRGCVYDGDGTVFIADKDEGKIYSFPGAAPSLSSRRLSVAIHNVTDPFGLAVFRSGAVGFASTWVTLAVIAASLYMA